MPTNGKSASESRDFREAEQISKEWICGEEIQGVFLLGPRLPSGRQ